MRGKSKETTQQLSEAAKASMRPAHYAREVQTVISSEHFRQAASMRPAHYAREVRHLRPKLRRGERLQ